MRDFILSRRESYITSLIRERPEALIAIEKRLRLDGKWGINLSDIEGQLLALLIRIHRPKNILEIGTQYGYSTHWLLKNLSADGKITTIEKNPEHQAVAQSHFGDSRIESICADAQQWMKQLLNNSSEPQFDFIFIDAEKSGYPTYFELSKKLLKVDGILIADNTMAWESVLEEEHPKDSKAGKAQWLAMKSFNNLVASSDCFESILLPTTEGLTISQRVK